MRPAGIEPATFGFEVLFRGYKLLRQCLLLLDGVGKNRKEGITSFTVLSLVLSCLVHKKCIMKILTLHGLFSIRLIRLNSFTTFPGGFQHASA